MDLLEKFANGNEVSKTQVTFGDCIVSCCCIAKNVKLLLKEIGGDNLKAELPTIRTKSGKFI